jgi:quercetin dioxygenase-like cupin family protein
MSQETAKAVAADMAGLVDYQDGSIVSRRIIKGKAGTVTLFAFDIAQSLSEHTAPFDALVHLLDGSAEITIAGKSSRLEQGDMIIIPAEEPHAVQAVSRFKMLLTLVRA